MSLTHSPLLCKKLSIKITNRDKKKHYFPPHSWSETPYLSWRLRDARFSDISTSKYIRFIKKYLKSIVISKSMILNWMNNLPKMKASYLRSQGWSKAPNLSRKLSHYFNREVFPWKNSPLLTFLRVSPSKNTRDTENWWIMRSLK